MLEFIKVHKFSIFCILAMIWIFSVMSTQFKYKKKGARLQGKIVNYVGNSGNCFPVFQFEYNGQHLTVDSYHSTKKSNELGQTEIVIYGLQRPYGKAEKKTGQISKHLCGLIKIAV